ncbi:hypothetical protein AALP_AA4G215600 [Arabis alpina]|uniref:DUF1685 domain-containing protein n=1 Tax=Arabis alpina TaxID=50452 RepID=A0A087H4S0_ARAAL|nr:hypothetical protein AALP_AA4G215600 [Arabis alpina]
MAGEEELLKLFEQNWSERSIFKKRKDPLNLNEKDSEKLEEPEIQVSFLVERAMSDETMMTTTSSKTSLLSASSSDDMFLSPRSVLTVKSTPMKLKTILSGKEVNEISSVERDRVLSEEEQRKKKKQSNVRTRTRRGKSMSDLECEEIKGFMDLGFVFSEEDHKDSDLVSILPGLQRLVKREDGVVKVTEEEEEDNRRPYMSEVWDRCERRKGKKQFTPEIKWRVPAPVTTNEVDYKDHLKLWAHAVASTIR